MWIEQRNLRSKLVKFEEPEREWLREYLSFTDASQAWRGTVKKESLFMAANNSFPSGFVDSVKKAAVADGFAVEVVDARVPPCEIDKNADLEWLRDYQQAAVAAVVARGRGLIWSPTGSGKTEMMVGFTRAMPCRWLALVHRKQLADDMASRYELRSPGLRAGRVGEHGWDVRDDDSLITCTFQSLQAALQRGVDVGPHDERYLAAKKLLNDAEGLVVDEAHTLPANTFYNIAMMTPNAYFRVGLSGTPLARGDRKSLFAMAVMGPVIYRIKTELLIERGVLAKPTVRMPVVIQQSNRSTWQSVYSELIVKSKMRNAKLVECTKRADKPAFLFVSQVDHGKALEKELLRAGIQASFVWGAHSVDWRRSHIKRLVQGSLDVLVCSAIFNEGIDVQELRSVIIGAAGKSTIAALQRIGRGMRVDRKRDGTVHDGGDKFQVFDIMDRGNKWTEKHARTRLAAYQQEGFEIYVEEPGTLIAP